MEKILDKVKKLLALANNEAAAEGERDNALRMAYGLLAKHNLAMADLNEHNAIEGREEQRNETFAMPWCKDVCHQMGKLFFCNYFSGRKINATKGTHHFVGKQSNAITASLMAEFIINSILKECRVRFGQNLAPASRSFSLGASVKIRERVNAMIKDLTTTGLSTENAVVIHNLYRTEADANKLFLESQGVKLKPVKQRATSIQSTHFNAGKEYGNGISLNGQIVNKNTLRIK